MYLSGLIRDKKLSQIKIKITGLSEDSREVKRGYIFFLKNISSKAKDYVSEATKNGAILIIHDKDIVFDIKEYCGSCKTYSVKNVERTMALLSKKYFGVKTKNFKIYGVTGTNGKSSVTNYIAQLQNLNKKKCALIGTLGNGIYPNLKYSTHTTPNIIKVNEQISNFQKKKVKSLSLEVSSHGLKQNRILGIEFDTTIFTNLSQDHLDYHKNMKNYFIEKQKLFSEYRSRRNVICIDDSYGKKILKTLANKNSVNTVSIKNANADFYANKIKFSKNGVNFCLNSKYGKKNIQAKAYGIFSIINIITAIAALTNNKKDFNLYSNHASKLRSVNGRMNNYIKKNYPQVFVDYAHTPDSIKKVLKSIKLHFPEKEIITVFGCGGDRDKTKRKIMGKTVSNYSNQIIITNDNPRKEDPNLIVKDIISGISIKANYQIILNRKKAIQTALKKNNKDKIVLIFGKGHENYQIFSEKKRAFNDNNEVKKILNLKK